MGGDAQNVIYGGVHVPSLPIPYIYGDLEGISRLEALPSSDDGYRTAHGFLRQRQSNRMTRMRKRLSRRAEDCVGMLDVDNVPADVI